jgi:hypothetical protein
MGREFWEVLGERVGGRTHFWTGLRYFLAKK